MSWSRLWIFSEWQKDACHHSSKQLWDGPTWIISHRVAMPSKGKVARRKSPPIAQFTHLLWPWLGLKFLGPDLEIMTHTKGTHSVVTGELRSPWSHLRSTWKGVWPVFRTKGTVHDCKWRCEVTREFYLFSLILISQNMTSLFLTSGSRFPCLLVRLLHTKNE